MAVGKEQAVVQVFTESSESASNLSVENVVAGVIVALVVALVLYLVKRRNT